jgi:anti-sigma factor RsiW
MSDPIDRRAPLECQDLVELVTDYLDDALSVEVRRSFDAHLGECDGCVHHLEQFRIAIRLARTTHDDVVEVPAETMSVLANAFLGRSAAGD